MTPRVLRSLLHASTALVLLTLLDSPQLLKLTLLAGGIAAMVVVQALFNISVVLGMMPTKGIPLPFISYGGSSLFVMLASVGVLLNITQQTD